MKPDSPFDPRVAAKKLLREARSGALATLMAETGDPYCSLVNVATAADGAPLLLISRLAVHTRNILADARVSLMLDERKEVSRAYDVGSMPLTVLIDREGVVRYVSEGFKPGYEKRYTEQLRKLLNDE